MKKIRGRVPLRIPEKWTDQARAFVIQLEKILDDIYAHLGVQSVDEKADKVADATEGNFAGLDSTGNLTDSGKKASDFAYTAGSGLGLENNEFRVAVPKVSESADHLPGAYSFVLREYEGGSNYNLPTNSWYHIYESSGQDPTYGVQLALSETSDAAYYRRKSNGTWGSWKSLIDTWRPVQDNLTTQSSTDCLSANQGYLLRNGSARDSTRVAKTGDTMTGNLTFNGSAGVQYEGTKATYKMIKFVDNTGDTYGNGISIGGGGLAIIGGGEAADTIASGKSGGEETLYLGSDGNVYIYTNTQSGMSSAKTFLFGSDGNISIPAGARISPSEGALYLGNSGNQNWVYVQDMCSQNGNTYWKIQQNGNATFNGTVTATTFSGSLSGNATTATNASALYVRSGSLVKGTNPSSTVWPGPTSFLYEKGSGTAVSNRIGGGIETSIQASGLTTLNLRAYQYASGSSNTNSLEIRIAKDGTCTYAVTSPANFRSAIGAGASAGVASSSQSGGTVSAVLVNNQALVQSDVAMYAVLFYSTNSVKACNINDGESGSGTSGSCTVDGIKFTRSGTTLTVQNTTSNARVLKIYT